MINWLYHVAFTFFAGYLALTNVALYDIGRSLPSVAPPVLPTAVAMEQAPASHNPIPKILLEQPQYQAANVIDATQPPESTTSPLAALVNIYCTYATKTYIRTTTGSGFFIDPKGIILTNAHVGQFLLLNGLGGQTKCEIRTGNPATPTYTADLLYISPAWIQNNADLITARDPKGTGERDYALLYVTGGLDHRPMPENFPYLSYNASDLPIQAIGRSVEAVGYPAATLLKQDGIDAPLIPKEATTTIKDLMTFGSNRADLMSIGGTDVGQAGSSGGPVLDTHHHVIGLISTQGDNEKYGAGSLRAITLAYVNRTIKEETGFTLAQNLSGNLPYRSTIFKETLVPFLKEMLSYQLQKTATSTAP